MLNLILKKLSLLSLTLFLGLTTHAAASHFTRSGELGSFRWTPPTYTTGFEYDILYYIPKSVAINPLHKRNAIVFLHGGGSSTLTREGSFSVAEMYSDDFIKIAEAQKLIVVLPSGSGLNWGGHTRVFLRELVTLMKAELPVDPNKIGLIGHSMGGMGITRSAYLLADQFAFAMPVAAGMDPKHMTEENLLGLYNIPYHHVQGLNDHFAEFPVRAKLHAEKMAELELKTGLDFPFQLTLTTTAHNYDFNQLSSIIQNQFAISTRNPFQKTLFGTMIYANRILTENGISYDYTPSPNYFWVEASQYKPSETNVRNDFEAKINGNSITINLKGIHNIQKLKVHLSSDLVDLKKPVQVTQNGQVRVQAMPTLKTPNSASPYPAYVEFEIK